MRQNMTDEMQVIPVPGPIFLELNAGDFINLNQVLSLQISEMGLFVTFRDQGWQQTFPLDDPTRERVLAVLRIWGQPHMIAKSPDRRWAR
jgi:hypothetical protein